MYFKQTFTTKKIYYCANYATVGIRTADTIKAIKNLVLIGVLFIVDGNIKGEYNVDVTASLRDRERALNN